MPVWIINYDIYTLLVKGIYKVFWFVFNVKCTIMVLYDKYYEWVFNIKIMQVSIALDTISM